MCNLNNYKVENLLNQGKYKGHSLICLNIGKFFVAFLFISIIQDFIHSLKCSHMLDKFLPYGKL